MTVKCGFLFFVSLDSTIYKRDLRVEQAQNDFKCFAIYWHGDHLDHLYKLFVPSQTGSTLKLSVAGKIVSEETKFESLKLNDL